MSANASRFPIVGIGASAGGVQALEGFFKGLNADCGMAFVVVTHLSPDRESLLHEVVGRKSEMPVLVAEDGAEVRSGNIYVMPQNAILSIEEGRLLLRRPNALHRERKPIDIFFSALAKDQGEYAVGVILSGGDGDGTLGVKAIKERGGLTLAQTADGSGPINPDMPESAISSGLIDLATPADEMGSKLIAFQRGLGLLDGLEAEGARGDEAAMETARQEIYTLLRARVGHDFSGYKIKTFLRRVQRRMQLLQIPAVDAYVERLRADAGEVANLFRDLLINVTNFFRDAEAFASLETMVIPKLFEGRDPSDTIRIWTPGCATGEEVYSIAILLREYMEATSTTARVQIFATDIDDSALGVARSGRYPEALLDSVSQERRDRFFSNDGSSYVINKDVRELCIFSSHSVFRDPPFSRMDLVSCRNLLIYFGLDIQSQVIPTFHYALKPGGYLFLGTSENIGQHAQLFSNVDKKQRIFQSREHSAAERRLPIAMVGGEIGHRNGLLQGSRRGAGAFSLRQTVESLVLESFAPPHVVVNSDDEIVFFSGRTGKYLEAAPGSPNQQLMTMARSGLRLDLRAALRQAKETRRQSVRENVAVDEDDDRVQIVNLTVRPIPDRSSTEPLYLVLFEDVGPTRTRSEIKDLVNGDPGGALADLDRDLRDTRERLQSTIEEYETALEELKSSNEELVSLNEETQSTNEELEASKEEMQSLNEELNTINTELTDKVEELDRANSDLRNLFESTEIATVFLDRNLVIRSFTPAASTFFSLIPADIGRPLTDLASHLAYAGLKEQIMEAFRSGAAIEHQIGRDLQGAHYLVRLIPYRNSDGKIDGVVVTFVDVSRLAEAEEHQKVLIAELNHRVKNMLAVVISIARQTLKGAPSAEAGFEAISRRLHAMARGYELLARENWTEASLSTLLSQELSPFGLERITLSGSDVGLNPKQGLSIAMVVHELATNAAKYGALSTGDGKLELNWSIEISGMRRLTILWREVGGPPVAPPHGRNFGLTLVQNEIEYGLGGEVSVDFASGGLEAKIVIPMDPRVSHDD
jgi:two-component system CheB/CheR fusion protein